MPERESVGGLLRTALLSAILAPTLIAMSAWAVILALFGAPRRTIDRVYTGFAGFALRVGGTPLEVEGLENLEPGRSYVVVANHESNWDPIALVAALRNLSLRFVAKKEIIAIPVFGRALLLTGNIRVERTNTQGDIHRIRQRMAERPLDRSMLFYAEGTRSRDGALHPFKKGAFVTALAYGMAVLPVGHAGCYWIWPPLKLRLRRNPVVVAIGKPIPIETLQLGDKDKLRDETHAVVTALRQRARRRVRELGGETGGID